MPDKWDQYAQPVDKWDQYASVSETPQQTPAEASMFTNLKQGAIGFGKGALKTVGNVANAFSNPTAAMFSPSPEYTKLEPTNTAQKVGSGLETAAEFAVPFISPGKKLATLGRTVAENKNVAGAAIGAIEDALKSTPVDASEAAKTVIKAKELAAGGGTLPKVFTDFMERFGLGNTPTPTPPAPITFGEARSFIKNSGSLSVSEKLGSNKEMHALVADFYNKMKDAANTTAVSAGHDTWKSVLADYAKATNMQEMMDVVKKWGIDSVVGALKYAPIAAGGSYAASKAWKLGQMVSDK